MEEKKDLETEELESSQEISQEASQEDREEESIELSEEEKLKAELEKKEDAVKELNDRLLRSMAEFDNFRKRTFAEKTAMYDNGVKDTVERLLPVIDNFERAVSTAGEEDKQSNIYKGIEMILKQLMEILDGIGVEEIPAEGEFDPNIHNAVMHIEDEAFGENQVAEVLQKGYKYNDKVIRPSMVKVAN